MAGGERGGDGQTIQTGLLVDDEMEIAVGNHALDGQYPGASTSAAVDLGFGLNVLAGGDGSGAIRQPRSVNGLVGARAILGPGCPYPEPAS